METLQNHKNSSKQEITWVSQENEITEQSWSATPEDEKYQKRVREQGYSQSDKEEFDSMSQEGGLTSRLRMKRLYCGSLCKVVQPYAGGGSDTIRPKNTLNTIKLHSGNGKHDQRSLRTRCWTVVIVVLMDMVTFIKVFMVGFFIIADMATVRITYHIWCLSSSPWTQTKEHQLIATCCEATQIVFFLWNNVFSSLFELPRALSQRSCIQMHMWRTPHTSALQRFKVGSEKSFHEIIRRWVALLVCDGLHLPLLRLDLLCTWLVHRRWVGMNSRADELALGAWLCGAAPYIHKLWTCRPCSTPTPTWTRAEHGLFQQWMWHMTMTTHFLTCPTSRCSVQQVHIFRWTLQHWPRSHQQRETPCEMFTVFNRDQIKQDWIRGIYRILKVYLQFLDLEKRLNWLHNELEKLCMISAKRLDVHSSLNKRNFLLQLINMKRRQNLANTLARHNEVHNYIVRLQVRQLERGADARFFTKNKGNCWEVLSGSKSRSWKSVRNLVTEVTSKVWWTKTSKYAIFVLNSVFKHQTKKMLRNINVKIMWLHQHLTRLVHETQQCRELFWRISSFPVNHWTRNCTTSTKRSRTSTRSTTAKECKSKIWRSILKQSHKTGIPWIQNLRRPADYSRFTQRGRTIESICYAAEAHQISWSKNWKSKKRESRLPK